MEFLTLNLGKRNSLNFQIVSFHVCVINHDRQCTYDLVFKRVRVTIFAVENQSVLLT